MLTDAVSVRVLFLACRLCYSHDLFSVHVLSERRRRGGGFPGYPLGNKLSHVSFYKFQGHQSHHEGPTLMTSFNFFYFPKATSPNTIPLGVRALTYEFGDATNIQSNKIQGCSQGEDPLEPLGRRPQVALPSEPTRQSASVTEALACILTAPLPPLAGQGQGAETPHPT